MEETNLVVLKERVQFFRHLGQTLQGFGRRLLSCPGGGAVAALLRPLRSLGLSLYVPPSAQQLLALQKVLVGVAERETAVLNLDLKQKKQKTREQKRH